MARIGVLDVDSFYPAKDRFELAMQINGLLAAPGFQSWLEGEPLDIDRMLFTAAGKPRVSIVSIAHLGDRERMFVVSLIANEVLAWMRRKSGTTSLRALFYVDEVAGYMPPVANPPSKPAMLTLLKQARAFGLGVVLSHSEPRRSRLQGIVEPRDVDDRQAADGSRQVQGARGTRRRAGVDRPLRSRRARSTLSGLGKRIFLMHNVHDDGPEVFETRWTMSYLRGPLTRDQIRQLTSARTSVDAADGAAATGAGSARAAAATSNVTSGAATAAAAHASAPASSARPVLAPGVPQFFVPPSVASEVDGAAPATPPRYQPRVFSTAQVGFVDARLGVREIRSVAALATVIDGPLPVDWSASVKVLFGMGDLSTTPEAEATFVDVPATASRPKSYDAWAREFARWIADNETLDSAVGPVDRADVEAGGKRTRLPRPPAAGGARAS